MIDVSLRGLALASLSVALLTPPAMAVEDGFTVHSGPSIQGYVGVTLPNGLGGYVYTCTTVPWSFTIPDTQWVSTKADCANATNVATGSYVYTMFFTVTPAATNIVLSGWVLADDGVTVALNGSIVPLTPSSFGGTFEATSGLRTGNTNPNTLTFTVNNTGGPTGLDFLWSVSWISPVAAGPVGLVRIAPTSKDECRRGGWKSFPQFENQGQCIRSVARRNRDD